MKHPKLTLLAQAVAASLLVFAASTKYLMNPASVEIFTSLDMEPGGRYLIASIEILAALLLLSPFAAVGSLLAVGVMCGAIIAHVSQLGWEVMGDGGQLVGMLLVVLSSSCFVLYSRRKQLPFIGDTL